METEASQKKIIIGVGILVLAAAGAWFGWWSAHRGPKPTAGTTIVAFGDSPVTGVGAAKGNDFISILSKRLGVDIINKGMPGDTSSGALTRIEPDVLALDPKVVILVFGGNDALAGIPKGDLKENLDIAISRITVRGATVILMGVRSGFLMNKYDEVYEELAGRPGVVYIPDILKGLFGDTRYMADPIHPNERGYEKIALRVEPVLKRMLQ